MSRYKNLRYRGISSFFTPGVTFIEYDKNEILQKPDYVVRLWV